MPYTTRRDLPKDWAQRRRHVFNRDGWQCTAIRTDGTRCPETTNLQCDHLGQPDDHRIASLTTLCAWHHNQKSRAQGNAARTWVSEKRPPEQHPGLR